MPYGVSTGPLPRKSVKCVDLGPRLARAAGQARHTRATAKQLAYDMGVDIDTVYGWAAGKGIRGQHLYVLIVRMPTSFANMIFGDTGLVVLKPRETEQKAAAAKAEHDRVMALLRANVGRNAALARDLRQIADARRDDAELDAIEREEQGHAKAAAQGRRVLVRDDPARPEVVPVLAEGARPDDALVGPALTEGSR